MPGLKHPHFGTFDAVGGGVHSIGYAAYASLVGDAKMSGQIQLAYCLVHARRNFVRVHKTTNSPFAAEVIERIAAV
ncbi:IS66 family transposase [Bradyrhizobium sp. CCGUVB1N3]|uniref:IS66 family transposase n=1 Tax=Bradyrhizobium sp. CCGUVB1N3 TaxID=2949629 RepID=UPI0020B27EF2|nr:IS66 family transposase [Bradyrhizobium sp. CCGUVB1N3]MCP3476617.1 IS66 family transposase [Bradyrhizobium sp. CCGUVB1N3]